MKFVMKCNAVVVVLMLLLFLTHGIMASMSTLGLFGNFGTTFSGLAFYLMFVHIGLTVLRTFQMFIPSLRSIKECKAYCQDKGGFLKGIGTMFAEANLTAKLKKQSSNFWITRFSGIVFLVLVYVHKTWIGFGASIGVAGYIMYALQTLLILSLGVHVIFNLKPLFSKIGIRNTKILLPISKALLSLILIFIMYGLAVYYFRF